MFDEITKKTLVIVYDDDSFKYADYFKSLIGCFDDDNEKGLILGPKDGTIQAAMWSEKQYLDNLSQMTSDTHVLFIGNFKTAKKIRDQYNKVFSNDFGMNFSSLGKNAVMWCDSRFPKKDEYNKFIDFVKKDMNTIQKSFEEKVQETSLAKKIWVGGPLFVVGGAAALGSAAAIHHFKLKNIYFGERNNALCLHIYLYYLSKFMEN